MRPPVGGVEGGVPPPSLTLLYSPLLSFTLTLFILYILLFNLRALILYIYYILDIYSARSITTDMIEKEIVPAGEIFTQGAADIQSPSPPGDQKFVQFLIPAVVAALQLAAGIGQNVANRKFQKEQQAKQQEYDLPSNQIQRLKDAGLNPNLALGQVSSGSFGDSPQPLQGIPELVGSAGANIFQGVNSMIQLQKTKLDMEALQERVRQLRLSNDFSEMSMGDRLKLVVANLLSADQVNNLRKFDLDFAKWYNDPNNNKFHFQYMDNEGNWHTQTETFFGSPREVAASYQNMYADVRLNKVYQDYLNAIQHGDYLSAQILGAQLGNDRQRIARDWEKASNTPWSAAGAKPLDKFLNFVLNGLMQRYGEQIMNKIYGWLDKW